MRLMVIEIKDYIDRSSLYTYSTFYFYFCVILLGIKPEQDCSASDFPCHEKANSVLHFPNSVFFSVSHRISPPPPKQKKCIFLVCFLSHNLLYFHFGNSITDMFLYICNQFCFTVFRDGGDKLQIYKYIFVILLQIRK